MKPTAIYLDMDGVICSFVGGVFRLFGHPEIDLGRVRRWGDIPRVLTEATGHEVTDAGMWRAIDYAGRGFWAGLEWLPWGRDLVELCQANAPVVLMTTPSGPMSAAGKLDWIARELGSEWGKRYALTTCKHHMAHPGALLVDDGQHNVDAFREHGGEVFLWPQSWNDSRGEALRDPSRGEALMSLRKILETL